MLRYDRHDRAQNEIQILGQGDRNDRLNVEGELVAVMRWTITEVFIRLKWYADERRNRIGQLLMYAYPMVLL